MIQKSKSKSLFFANKKALNNELEYLAKIFDVGEINTNKFLCFRSDVFLRWGLKKTIPGILTDKLADIFNKKKLYIEDGFIRSINLGLSGEPTLSVISDDISLYYDSTIETSFQKFLNSDFTLTNEQSSDVDLAIKLILNNKISKYNNTSIDRFEISEKNSKKILLVDQRYGDYSVIKGGADESSFRAMLNYAIVNYPDYEIIIKKHPDSKFDGQESYLSSDLIASFKNSNIKVLTDEINPYTLFEEVKKVFVVTSQMGFEALLAGKEVHCFGVPFYCGRGLTFDHLSVPVYMRQPRSLKEIFYTAYFAFTSYYSPTKDERCDIFEVISYILDRRKVV